LEFEYSLKFEIWTLKFFMRNQKQFN